MSEQFLKLVLSGALAFQLARTGAATVSPGKNQEHMQADEGILNYPYPKPEGNATDSSFSPTKSR